MTHSGESYSRELGWYWLAYYGDWSGFAVFETELAALRYAVEKEMKVLRVPTEADIREYASKEAR